MAALVDSLTTENLPNNDKPQEKLNVLEDIGSDKTRDNTDSSVCMSNGYTDHTDSRTEIDENHETVISNYLYSKLQHEKDQLAQELQQIKDEVNYT